MTKMYVLAKKKYFFKTISAQGLISSHRVDFLLKTSSRSSSSSRQAATAAARRPSGGRGDAVDDVVAVASDLSHTWLRPAKKAVDSEFKRDSSSRSYAYLMSKYEQSY